MQANAVIKSSFSSNSSQNTQVRHGCFLWVHTVICEPPQSMQCAVYNEHIGPWWNSTQLFNIQFLPVTFVTRCEVLPPLFWSLLIISLSGQRCLSVSGTASHCAHLYKTAAGDAIVPQIQSSNFNHNYSKLNWFEEIKSCVLYQLIKVTGWWWFGNRLLHHNTCWNCYIPWWLGQHHGCWCPGSLCHHDINNHGTDCAP